MGRKRKSKNGDLLKPVAVFIALLVFANARRSELVAAYAVIILVLSAAIYVVFLLLRKRSKTATTLSATARPISRTTRTSPPAMDALDKEFERRHTPSTIDDPKPTEWTVGLIRALEWKRFEDLCADYFKAKGHRAEVTKHGADGGIDILLYGVSNPDKVLGIIQCKSWKERVVGVGQIRELFGVMTDAGCPLAIFVTISGYSKEAEAFAEGKHIKLLDARKLFELIQSLPVQQQAELLKKATLGDYKTPSCPSCGIKLVLRTAGKGSNKGSRFWGCQNYPRCRYTMRANSA
jgi:restriction system protein